MCHSMGSITSCPSQEASAQLPLGRGSQPSVRGCPASQWGQDFMRCSGASSWVQNHSTTLPALSMESWSSGCLSVFQSEAITTCLGHSVAEPRNETCFPKHKANSLYSGQLFILPYSLLWIIFPPIYYLTLFKTNYIFFPFLTNLYLLSIISPVSAVQILGSMQSLDLISLPCQIWHELPMKKMKQTVASVVNASNPTLENNAAPIHETGNSRVSAGSPLGNSSQQFTQKISKTG